MNRESIIKNNIILLLIILSSFSMVFAIGNPASTYCIDQGYTLEIRTADDGGQYGVCIDQYGSECEEWAFFRGECELGTELSVFEKLKRIPESEWSGGGPCDKEYKYEICNAVDDDDDCTGDTNGDGVVCGCTQNPITHKVSCDSGVDEGRTYILKEFSPLLDNGLLHNGHEEDVTIALQSCSGVEIPSDTVTYYIDLDWNDIWNELPEPRECHAETPGDKAYCHTYELELTITHDLVGRRVTLQYYEDGDWYDLQDCSATGSGTLACDISSLFMTDSDGDNIYDLEVDDITGLRLKIEDDFGSSPVTTEPTTSSTSTTTPSGGTTYMDMTLEFDSSIDLDGADVNGRQWGTSEDGVVISSNVDNTLVLDNSAYGWNYKSSNFVQDVKTDTIYILYKSEDNGYAEVFYVDNNNAEVYAGDVTLSSVTDPIGYSDWGFVEYGQTQGPGDLQFALAGNAATGVFFILKEELGSLDNPGYRLKVKMAVTSGKLTHLGEFPDTSEPNETVYTNGAIVHALGTRSTDFESYYGFIVVNPDENGAYDRVLIKMPSDAINPGTTTIPLGICGNGILESGEVCDDGNADNTDACLDGVGGTCQPATCGDGFVWAGIEECDGTNFGDATCQDYGFLSGGLTCTANCLIDVTACLMDECRPSESRQCYTGPDGTENVGECRNGEQICANGQWGSCEHDVTPATEVCNGKDDDCDGTIDNACPPGQSCVNGECV